MVAWLSFTILTLIGLAHSALGEALLIGPLLRDPSWRLGVSRPAADRILRFAWHLTTLAWVGLAATLVGVPTGVAMGLTCLLSGVIVFVRLRAHLAWPLFLLAGLTALHAQGNLPEPLRLSVAGASVTVAVLAALLHLYWAFGGRWGMAAAVPKRSDGRPAFEPGPLACLAVVVALLTFAALVGATAVTEAPTWVRALTGAALLLLTVRAVGDRRQVGFTKTNRKTDFARADDALFTPLVVVLALGAAMALLPA